MKKSNNGSDYEDSIKHLQNIMKAVKKTPATTESISIKDESVEYSSESSDNDGSKKENPKKESVSKSISSKSDSSKPTENIEKSDSAEDKKSSLGNIFKKVDKILDEDLDEGKNDKKLTEYSSKNDEPTVHIQKTLNYESLKNAKDFEHDSSFADDDKLSFDKLEIDETEESKINKSDEGASFSFEDNILNNVDDIFEDDNKPSKNDKEDINMSLKEKSDENDLVDSEDNSSNFEDIEDNSDKEFSLKSKTSSSFLSKLHQSFKEVEEDNDKDEDKNKSKDFKKESKTENSIFDADRDKNTKPGKSVEDNPSGIGIKKVNLSIIPILGIIVGIVTISLGIYLVFGRSARVVDSVASGEYVGMSILLFIIGAICFIFSLIQIVSVKTPFDNTFDEMRSIDREDINMDDFLDEITVDDIPEGKETDNEDLDDETEISEEKYELEDNEDNYNVTKKSFDSDYVKTDADDFKITVNTSVHNEEDDDK